MKIVLHTSAEKHVIDTCESRAHFMFILWLKQSIKLKKDNRYVYIPKPAIKQIEFYESED